MVIPIDLFVVFPNNQFEGLPSSIDGGQESLYCGLTDIAAENTQLFSGCASLISQERWPVLMPLGIIASALQLA
jgi:hypothetical protein